MSLIETNYDGLELSDFNYLRIFIRQVNALYRIRTSSRKDTSSIYWQ